MKRPIALLCAMLALASASALGSPTSAGLLRPAAAAEADQLAAAGWVLPPNVTVSPGDGCPAGQHKVPLHTVVLTLPSYHLSRADGGLLELRAPLAALPPYSPHLLNDAQRGLEQGLLETQRLLADWAAGYVQGAGAAEHVSPIGAIGAQCDAQPPATLATACASPSNAQLLLHGARKASGVVDIERVAVDAGEAVLSLRWVADPETLPEGAAGCHAPQSSDPADRHYHHVAGCGYEAGSAADTLEALLQAPAAAGPQGATLTAFVKFMIAREGDAWNVECGGQSGYFGRKGDAGAYRCREGASQPTFHHCPRGTVWDGTDCA